MKNISFQNVNITGGFWKERQTLNRETTAKSVYDRFTESGRFSAFALDWKEGMPNRPHYFWDSDVAKWLEGAAYLLAKQPDAQLEAIVDRVVEQIRAGQDENGYFNIYFTVVSPDKRFTDRNYHELYCAGHLIEAACAYYQATGKDTFLRLMCKYADYIERVFCVEKSASFSTPGHEEIELALVRLYETTGEERYLALAKHFVDTRGTVPEGGKDCFWGSEFPMYNQSHLPVREQKTAEGHSVRATYLYCAMADLAKRYGDQALLDACRALFHNIAEKRMYVTGGIGSAHDGEAFTVDYDLPNTNAYTETCAAIGLVLFAHRMQELEVNTLYGDVIERVLYNGFLSGTSLDGKSFFYTNPLEIRLGQRNRVHCLPQRLIREWHPMTTRLELFDCSCCPPNIFRFVASLGDLLYTVDEKTNTIYCHQYMTSEASFPLGNGVATLSQESDFPYSGRVRLTYHGPDATVALRIPSWANGYTCAERVSNGYRMVPVTDGCVIDTEFPMQVRLIEANPCVQEDSGRYAVSRGPLLFCMEGIDNGDNLRDVCLLDNGSFVCGTDAQLGVMTLTCDAVRRKPMQGLYRFKQTETTPFRAKLIPYYAFANRGETEMLLWTQVK